MKRLRDEQKGQALPLALIALGIGAFLVGSFLSYVSTNLIASRVFGRLTEGQHTADAGVEDAIWNLMYGNFTANVLTFPGDSTSYSLDEPVNGLTPDITVTRTGQTVATVASDDFESGDWSGGSGWSADWYHEGDAQIVRAAHQSYQGDYHLNLQASTGYVKRAVDILGKENVHLQFWAKALSFESGEEAQCLISSNGSDWESVETWVEGDDDGDYHFYDIDLSQYATSSEFWIAFDGNMSGSDDLFFVDAVSVVTTVSCAGLPRDNFESGDWSGGTGWLSDWAHEGSAQTTRDEVSREGLYHLEMSQFDSYVNRSADLSGQSDLRLQFWARARSFEKGDEMQCLVSSDGSDWATAKTWTNEDSDNTYHFVDIDLSPYAMSSQFWIAFDSGLGDKNDFFYVDDLRIVNADVYQIVSVTATETIEATVIIEGADLSVVSWQIG
jgi:hypothetical protein